jgi:sortase A
MKEWSAQRREAFSRFLQSTGAAPIAAIALPRLQVRVPVFAGVNEFSMTVGAGHLTETSSVQGGGNIALTAHRDGSFRMLKDVRKGDRIELSSGAQVRRFRVARHFIVDPEDVSVLAPTEVPTLTLITCYPFWFVGKAPQRYIVQAELEAADTMNRRAGDPRPSARRTALTPASINSTRRRSP